MLIDDEVPFGHEVQESQRGVPGLSRVETESVIDESSDISYDQDKEAEKRSITGGKEAQKE